ncbi:hypothetical protein MRX96_009156 [Rhipicephalus microplus]
MFRVCVVLALASSALAGFLNGGHSLAGSVGLSSYGLSHGIGYSWPHRLWSRPRTCLWTSRQLLCCFSGCFRCHLHLPGCSSRDRLFKLPQLSPLFTPLRLSLLTPRPQSPLLPLHPPCLA